MTHHRSRLLRATVLGAIALFLFDGAFQAIPGWGIRAVEQTHETSVVATSSIQAPMNYRMTPDHVQFIVTKPARYYDPVRFLAIEALSALLIAGVMAALFVTLPLWSLRQRISIAFLFGLIACLAIHLPYANWWGFSLPYTSGVMVKTVLGWTGVAYLQNRWVYRIKYSG